jgi:hypothetical protein
MSEQPVKKSDLVEGNPIDDLAAELARGLKSLEAFDLGLKDIAATMSGEVKKTTTDTLKGIKAVNDAEIQSEKLLRAKIATEKDLVKLDQEKTKLDALTVKREEARARAAKKVTDQINREAKAEEKLKQARIKAQDPLKKLVRLTKEAKEHTARLALTQGVNSQKTKIAQKRYEALDNKLRQVNTTTRNGRKSLTELIHTNDRLGLSFRKLSGLAAQFGLALGGAAIIKGGIKLLTDFDEKVADVAKTTNLSTEAARDLSMELLKIDTRTPIGELQELASAAGRLGLEGTANIIGFARAADKVFVALGDDLGGSAEEIARNLGKISALFGFESEFGIEEGIERVGSGINELSANSKASAGAIQDFTNRMGGLASVLKLADVQALGALFDESGQSIEVASSALTKLLPELANDFERFAKVAGVTPEAFKKIAEESPVEALKLVAKGAKSSEKGVFALSEVIESFGINSARATGIVGVLTNNVDRLGELQGVANKAMDENTSISDENAKKQATLAATWEKLQNSVKAYILGSDGATSASEGLKNALRFLSKNLVTIVKVLGIALKLFIAWKVAIAAMKINEAARNFKKFGSSAEKAGESMTKGASSANAFGKSLKSIGFAVAITLALEFANMLLNIVDGSNEARKAEERRAKMTERSNKKATERIEGRADAQKKALAENERQLIKGIILEDEFLKKKLEIIKASKDGSLQDIKEVKARKEGLKQQIIEGERLLDVLSNVSEGMKLSGSDRKSLRELGITGITNSARAGQEIDHLRRILTQFSTQIDGTEVKLTQYRGEVDGLTEDTKDADAETKKFTRSSLADAAAKGEQAEAYKDLTAEIMRQEEVERTAREEKNQFKIDNLKSSSEDELEKEIQNTIRTGDINTKMFKKRIDEEKQLRRAIIERQFLEDIDNATSSEDVILANQRRSQALARLDDEIVQRKIEGIEQLNDAQEQYEQKRRDADNAEEARRIESLKEELESFQQIQQALVDAMSNRIDKQIALRDKDIQDAKSNQDFFKELAANGNIEAKDSIKEQIQFEKEAQREKERLEKRKAQVAIASSFLKVFENELAEGKPVLQAISSATLASGIVTGILSDLLFFEKGTMDAPEGMAVVDEKGAEIITDKQGNIKSMGTTTGPRLTHLQAGDKVYTAAQTAKKMSELENIGNAQSLVGSSAIAGNSYDFLSMQKGIVSGFNDAIKKMPHSSTDWQGVINGVGKVVTENRRGNDVERTNTWIQ